MSDDVGTERCTRCGAEYAMSSSPLGLCPACLLKLGMSGVALAPPEPDPEDEPVAPPMAVSPSPAGRRVRLPPPGVWVAIALGLLIVATAFFLMRASPRQVIAHAHASPVRFTLTLPDEA